MSKEQIDRIINKWISRKLTVFFISTIALFTNYINDENWMIIATAYITMENVTRIVERLKNK